MKRILSLIFIVSLLFTSCKSAILLTHSQVMDKYQTEEQVVQRFGLPDREVKSDGVKQWYYDYGSVSRTSTYNPQQTANSTVSYNAYTDQINVNTNVNATVGSKSTRSYNKYVKFLIDEETKFVKTWQSQGVNLEKIDKQQRTKNIIIGTLAVIVPTVIYLIIDEQNFQKELAQDDYDYYND